MSALLGGSRASFSFKDRAFTRAARAFPGEGSQPGEARAARIFCEIGAEKTVEDHAGGSARFGVQTFAEYLNEIQASGSGL